MALLWAFVAGWCLCVWEIVVDLHGTPWHAVAVSSRKHVAMARFLWQHRNEKAG